MADVPAHQTLVPLRWNDAAASEAAAQLARTLALVSATRIQLRLGAERTKPQWRGAARDSFDIRLARLLGDLGEFESNLEARQAVLRSQMQLVERQRLAADPTQQHFVHGGSTVLIPSLLPG